MYCTDCCEYTTNKEVRIRSVSLGTLKSLICLAVFIYMCYILISEKRYQKKDSIISSVHTKVKGVLDVDSRIWDTAEYTFPSPGGDSFFVLTNIIKTEKQVQGRCPEFPSPKTICSRDDICKKGYADPQSNGIQTGQCIKFNSTIRTCEISAWCPVESKSTPEPAVLGNAENFTVLIKNNIHFAAFNYTTKNILPEYNISCIFDTIRAPQCPIFRLGDILKEGGENFSQVAVLGGIMGIEIHWKCDLDFWAFNCRPKYCFRRLDDKIVDERLYPGLNFRFARYYKTNQAEQRTLIKAYGIRFDIQVYGTGGQFRWYELVLFIGSYLSYFGLTTIVIDFLITRYYTSCCSERSALKYYDDLKYEKASGPGILKTSLICDIKDLYKQHPPDVEALGLTSQDGLFYRERQIHAPPQSRTQILEHLHDHPLACHGGQHKIKSLVSKYFWWPSMEKTLNNMSGPIRFVFNTSRCITPSRSLAAATHPQSTLGGYFSRL